MPGTTLRIQLDDRGASRPILDLWIPHLDVDVVWLIGAPPPDETPPAIADLPMLELSPHDLAAVLLEQDGEDQRALAIFTSPELLGQAAALGLAPARATITHLCDVEVDLRVSPELSMDAQTLETLQSLESQGFTFEIQALPNVTPRPWIPSRSSAETPIELDPTAR